MLTDKEAVPNIGGSSLIAGAIAAEKSGTTEEEKIEEELPGRGFLIGVLKWVVVGFKISF